jgi:hypothetical protein
MNSLKKKIGILTLPSAHNYGWALQLWALYTFLKVQGYDPIVIDRRWNNQSMGSLYKIKRYIYKYFLCYNFTQFISKHLKKTNEIRKSCELANLNLDAYIVGSDQVWRIEHTRGAELNFFLDFLENDDRPIKISYAASFGTDQWEGTPKETEYISKLLKKFDLITVREDSGIELCKNIFDISNVHCVLDPTLLIEPETYYCLINKNRKQNKDYIVTYLLDYSIEKESFVNSVSQETGLDVYHLYKKKNNPYHVYGSIENWLQKIHDAKYVIVDSFHGMCFAIIFKKDFVVIANRKRGLTRFTSTLIKFDLLNRLIYDITPVTKNILYMPIDYTKVSYKLQSIRDYSKKILLNVINK